MSALIFFELILQSKNAVTKDDVYDVFSFRIQND